MKQPEALRLADSAETCQITVHDCALIAAELRRLHEVNVELVEALKEAANALADYIPLLEKRGTSLFYGHSVLSQSHAAIAKATGEQQ